MSLPFIPIRLSSFTPSKEPLLNTVAITSAVSQVNTNQIPTQNSRQIQSLMAITQSNMNPAIHLAAATFRQHQSRLHLLCHRFVSPRAASFRRLTLVSVRVRAYSTNDTQPADVQKLPSKPPICTADELHYVTVNNSDWRLALWRYNPSPQVLSSFCCALKLVSRYCRTRRCVEFANSFLQLVDP